MAGEHHDIILELLRAAPQALAVLLRERGVHLPPSAQVRALDPNARQLRPVEFAADLVLRFAWRARRTSVIVEVQRKVDADKRLVWPLYFAHFRTRSSEPVELVVLATNRRTAAWAREPIVDTSARMRFTPLVLGPDDVPVLDDSEAFAQPGLAMLSALVHLEHDDRVAIAARAVRAWHRLDAATSGLYLDALMSELGADDAEQLKEVLMERGTNPYRSEFMRRMYDEATTEGKAEGLAIAVLDLLELRGFELDADTRAHVTACIDLDTLRAWHTRAVSAASLAEIFEA